METVEYLRRATPDLVVIALLDTETVDAYATSLAAGAVGAFTPEASSCRLALVLDMARQGLSLLPIGIAREIAKPRRRKPVPTCLTPLDIRILRALGRGDSVASLASEMSYSERSLHRMLRGLYERIGAANRSEAIVLAASWGIVSPGLRLTIDLTEAAWSKTS
ncbi:MAG TPA: response regulator transcription factor [Actinobacteria bacterium]|nr:response regulator transcription factor [Actinomycetota bacterium]